MLEYINFSDLTDEAQKLITSVTAKDIAGKQIGTLSCFLPNTEMRVAKVYGDAALVSKLVIAEIETIRARNEWANCDDEDFELQDRLYEKYKQIEKKHSQLVKLNEDWRSQPK